MTSDEGKRRLRGGIVLLVVIGLMVGLRVVALDSDAYPRLSWSSALLTDEGFYIHNARNTVLFGHPQTDQFNNDLIMPLLNAVQVAVFRTFGVGAVQARAISVVLGLLTLPLFWDALRRAFGRRAAMWGTLFLGLDHVSLLYSRLALMDTPAAFVLVAGFWAWVRSGEREPGSRGQGVWLGGCGVVLGLCYGVRGLGALVYVVPVWLLWQEMRRTGTEEQKSGIGRRALPLLCLLGGLGVSLGGYVLVWYLPHRAELARVNHYYLFDQLVPHSLYSLWLNFKTNLLGDQHGFSSYLLRHTPIQFGLVLLGFAAWCVQRKKFWSEETERRNGAFLAGWLCLMLFVFGGLQYSPSRYYVLFYPALSALAALMLTRLETLLLTVWEQRAARVLLGGFLTYHLLEAGLHHTSALTDFCLYGGTASGMLVLFWWKSVPLPFLAKRTHRASTVVLLFWGAGNLGWTADWLTTMRWTQREAEHWLDTHLPAQSVLVGDAAPGLAMNSRFVAVSVLPGLCNDVRPVETFAPSPRYIVVLDGAKNLRWWNVRYPAIVRPDRVLHRFAPLVGFAVNVYEVPPGASIALPPARIESR